MFSCAWCSPNHREDKDESDRVSNSRNITCLLEGVAYRRIENDIIE